MLSLNDGRTIVIAADGFAEPGIALTFVQWLMLFSAIAIAFPVAGLLVMDPGVLHDVSAVVVAVLGAGAVLAAIVIVRHLFALIMGSSDLGYAVFDLDNEILEVVFVGVFGWTKSIFSLSEIDQIRFGRGEWNGAIVNDIVVVVLESRQTIVLPNRLTARELTTLKVVTGVRR